MCKEPRIDQSIKSCLKWKFIGHRAFRGAGGSVYNIIDPLVQWNDSMKLDTIIAFLLSLTLFLTVPGPARAQVTPGVLTSHEADETIVYHWFSYVPIDISKEALNYILIEGQNGNIQSDNYQESIDETRWLAESWMQTADAFNYILLTPVIPRSLTNWQFYTVALDRESLMDPTDFNQRADLKVNLMIGTLISSLRSAGYRVHDKVFVSGFSAGAMFAQRYCLLHPERVRGIAGGQCGGSLTVPGSRYNGVDMNWPVGVNDFRSLVGYDFNMSYYQQIPQFIYIGDQDINGSTVAPGNHDLFTDEQMKFLNETFGDNDPVRLENQYTYMSEQGCKVELKLYPGVAHQITSDMINDTYSFFAKYRTTEPTVVSGEATSLKYSSATLNAIVNPNGANTSYYFEYGTSTDYGSSTGDVNIGGGTSDVSVNASITELNFSTIYHFRVVATSSFGTGYGSDKTFTTDSLMPTVSTLSATLITPNSATLNGAVNPNGEAATYYFEYGLDTSYGSTTSSGSAGSGTSSVSVNASIFGLISDTTYHYRLAATNSSGTSYGNDETFSTTILYVEPFGSCGGNTPCYSTVLAAVDAATSGATIKIAEGTYDENLNLNSSKEVTIQGGWDSTFTTQSSTSTVNSLTISNGAITVDNLVVQ